MPLFCIIFKYFKRFLNLSPAAECVALSPHGLSGTRCVGDSREAVHVPSRAEKHFLRSKKCCSAHLIFTSSSPPKSYPQHTLVLLRARAVMDNFCSFLTPHLNGNAFMTSAIQAPPKKEFDFKYQHLLNSTTL